MKEAVDEVIVVVWAQVNSLDWPILYANQAWVDMTGVRVTPPLRFPGRPKIEDVRPLPEASRSETGSLWDYLWLQSDGVDEVVNLWKHVYGDMTSGSGMAQPFAKSAVLAPRLVNGSSSSRVSCRFMPAELPLDVAAAAIRPASQYAADFSQRIAPAGYSQGHLYFVTITRLAFAFTSEISRVKSKLPQPTIPEEDENEDESDDGDATPNLDAHPAANGGSVSVRSDSEASVKVKPPVSPYPDVRLLRVLEDGNFGKLYFGTWAGACVGVKVVTSDKATDDWDKLDSIFLTSIANANVAQQYFFDVQVDEVMQERHLWMVREWCDGGDLGTYCKEQRVEGKGLWELIQIILEIASGLQYMLGRGIIHGALTPSNVLLKSQAACRKGYICKVSDFGFARLRRRPRLRTSAFASSSSNVSVPSEGGPVKQPYEGIAPHMPPEDIMAERDKREPQPCPKGDVFALGMIMYQVAAGERPSSWLPRGDLPADFASAMDRGRWLRLPSKAPGELSFVYMRCIAANPAERLCAAEIIERMSELSLKFDPDADPVQETYRRVGTAPVRVRSDKSRLNKDMFTSNPMSRRAYTPPGSDSSMGKAKKLYS